MPSLLASLGLDVSPFRRGLLEAKSDAREAGEQLQEELASKLGSALSTVGVAAGIEEVVRHAIEYSEQVENMSNRLGISTEAIQRWDHALQMSGSSIEAAQGFFVKLAVAKQKAMDGDEKMIDAFHRLGVELASLKSQRLEDIGQQIALKVETGDVQKMLGDLRTVGGRGAVMLAGAFKNEFSKKMEEAPVASEEAMNELRNLGEGIKTVWRDVIAGTIGILGPIIGGIRITLQEILAGFVGLGKGAAKMWEVLSEPSKNPNSPLESIRQTIRAVKAGFSEAKDTVKDFNDGMIQQEADRLNRKKEAEGMAGLGEGDENVAVSKQKQIDKLKEESAKITREAAIAELQGMEKQRALLLEIANLRKKMAAEKDPLKQAELGVEVARAEANFTREKAQTEREIARIKSETAKTSFADSLREMTSAERIEAIAQKIAELKAQAANEGDALKQAQLDQQRQKFESELAQAQKREEEQQRKKEAAAFQKSLNEVEANVKIGAYGGDPMLNIGQATQKSAEHLGKILSVLHEHTRLLKTVRN